MLFYLTTHANILVMDRNDNVPGQVPLSDFAMESMARFDMTDMAQSSEVWTQDGLTTFARDGLYLTSAEYGVPSFAWPAASGWEKFIEIEAETVPFLARFLQMEFVWCNPAADGQVGRPRFQGHDTFQLLGYDFPIRDNLTNIARYIGGREKTLYLTIDGWRMFAFEQFNPVIYYCVFGSESQIDLMLQSMISCVRFGNYTGKFIVLTNMIDLCRGRLSEFSGRVELLFHEANDLYRYWQARYQIVEYPEFGDYSPIVYLDTDIAVDLDIQSTLIEIQRSSKISVYFEGPRVDERDSFGRTLFVEDHIRTGSERGVNSGMFGFRSLQTGYEFLRMTRDTIDNIYNRRRGGEALRYFDQSVANYVLYKYGLVDPAPLKGRVRTFWEGSFECGDRPAGFCHFTTKPKNPSFENYIKALEAYHRSSSSMVSSLARLEV